MSTAEDSRDLFHRKVQARIAGQFLKEIDPDALTDPDRYGPGSKGRLSDHMDKETQLKFEKKYGKYRRKESAFSITNILWLITGMAVFYFSDIIMVVRFDPRIDRLWFNIGAAMLLVNVCIAAFFIVFLSFIKKLSTDDWEKKYPALIPVATAAFVFGGICVVVGLWPVWGVLTIPILTTIFMSFIVVVAMFG